MAFYNPKRNFHSCSEDEDCGKSDRSSTTKTLHEQEKRMRREIANSNERRRMQNINAGLQSLKEKLPFRGAKLSKVAILQGAAEYVHQLEKENSRLFLQVNQLSKELETVVGRNNSDCSSSPDSPEPRKKHHKTVDSMEEGVTNSPRCDNGNEEELLKLKRMLQQERAYRIFLEDQVKSLQFRLSSKPIDNKRSVLVMNSGLESGVSSPRSQLSNQDLDLSVLCSSPEYSGLENSEPAVSVPVIIPFEKTDTNVPESRADVETSRPSSPSEMMTRARQNLYTIVEAIKHVEGTTFFQAIKNE